MASRPITVSEFFRLKESSLGERLRFFREEVGKLNSKQDYSTKALGQRLGVTPQSITAIERGDSKNPSYQLIYGLAKELHVPLDVLNDDFYQHDIKLFSIGTSEEVEPPSANYTDELDPALASSFYLGCYVYQVFPDDRMRFIYNQETVNPVDYKTFIQCLSRFISEIELHSRSEDLLRQSDSQIAPLNQAVALFKASMEHPKAFPIFPKKLWDQHYDLFLEKHEQKESQNNGKD